ncbi:MAG: hypothetical protein D6732_18545 [Methanobacteriota archaeon]|nr:MAG: hypothetical protein D6732_18545 [Euryarchaeota archaeon]
MHREGWIGALLDEYERSINEFLIWSDRIESSRFEEVIDPETEDPDCRSFRSICEHVVNAGHGYNHYLEKYYLEKKSVRVKVTITKENLKDELRTMFSQTEKVCNELRSADEEWLMVPFQSDWGQEYDTEQLLEHAVLHVLRHRRQLEKFIEQISLKGKIMDR